MVEETTPVRRSSEIETRVGTRVDNALPRTWHRDLVFARTLLGSTPIGVLWLNRLQNGQRSQACYRLAVLSEYRLFVSNGKAGMVSGFTEHAHLFDLVKVEYKPGDRTVFCFRKLRVEVDDTVGTQLLSTLWRTLGAISAEVPPARLPQLDAGARRVVDDRAGKESEIPNFKASYLGRFPLVLADFWTSDHLSERSRSVDAFSGTRVRGTRTLKRR